MYYQKNYKDFIPRVSTKNYRYRNLWLVHMLRLNKILHFAPDFQPLILLLLPSCFDVLFLYSLFFSQGAQGEKLGTHWLPLSKPTFLGLFDKWVSATTPREELLLLTTDCCCCWCFFPGHTTQFCLILFPLLLVSHYFTTKLGLDQKTQFGRKQRKVWSVALNLNYFEWLYEDI